MTTRDVLVSPYSWAVFGICCFAGWYVKRNLRGALTYGLIAPLFLVPLWWTVLFCFSIPYLILSRIAPEFSAEVGGIFGLLPGPMQVLLSPPFLVTVCLFVIYCRSDRDTSDLRPAGGAAKQSGCQNPFRRKIL